MAKQATPKCSVYFVIKCWICIFSSFTSPLTVKVKKPVDFLLKIDKIWAAAG